MRIIIQEVQLYSGTPGVSNVSIVGVGIRGGTWNYHQYDSDGLNGHYPVYGEAVPGANNAYYWIHVRSRVDRTYTLQDFFNVWGQALGKNDTLTLLVPPPHPSSSTGFPSDTFWDMCVQVGGGSIQRGSWTSEALVPNLAIVLRYSEDGCMPLGG